jgi:Amidase
MIGVCTKDKSSVSPSMRRANNIKFVFRSPYIPLPSGPYFLSPFTGNVYKAYRLYTDGNYAFIYGVVSASNATYRQLSAHTDGADTATVGVPSRLFYTPIPAKPFAGSRLAAKDIFDVERLTTGCGNRAYYQTYPVKDTTGPAIQRLVDLDMVIISKVKTSQSATREKSTGDWIDLHAPYNPIGDGYQHTSSPSTGSGSAMASYDWFYFAVGSDTEAPCEGLLAGTGCTGIRCNIHEQYHANVSYLLHGWNIFERCAVMGPGGKTMVHWFQRLHHVSEEIAVSRRRVWEVTRRTRL